MIGTLEEVMKDMKCGVFEFTKDGKCSGCGQCCSNYLPISSKEIKEIKRYVKKHHITEQKHNYPSVVAFDLTCPFLDDSKEKEKCLIYPVRPEICRDFVCNNPNGAIKNKKLMHKKYAAVDMREIFLEATGMNNKEILQKAKELVELLEKQEETGKVELSTLKRGEVFQTTGKRKYKVLEQYGDTTKIISLDLVKENVEFGDTSDYKTSNVKKLCDTEILKDFEEEFGAENVETHTADIITADGQKLGTVDCKIRPITFDEAREYTDITPNNDLNDWYWTLSPWSTEERGWKKSIAIVSPSGVIYSNCFDNVNGVRPVCILKSNIFVSKVEE